ncbi:MAG: hypothetical protein JST54_21845 [Deltaproteobacteria bacterium]|nr:hypothetical protein [Deltaproteobacteria bacterium]
MKRTVRAFRGQRLDGTTGRPVVPPRSKLCVQMGGFAGPFASPGLGIDDASEEISGFTVVVMLRF